jgi:hypothetical protein
MSAVRIGQRWVELRSDIFVTKPNCWKGEGSQVAVSFRMRHQCLSQWRHRESQNASYRDIFWHLKASRGIGRTIHQSRRAGDTQCKGNRVSAIVKDGAEVERADGS